MEEDAATKSLERILTVHALRTPRRYEDFVNWVEEVEAASGATRQTRKVFRLGNQMFKTFREEVLPFRILASHLYAGKNVRITFPSDNGRRDVIVTELDEGERVQEFEITVSGRDYEDRLRMELLSLTGRAPGFGPINEGSRECRIGLRRPGDRH